MFEASFKKQILAAMALGFVGAIPIGAIVSFARTYLDTQQSIEATNRVVLANSAAIGGVAIFTLAISIGMVWLLVRFARRLQQFFATVRYVENLRAYMVPRLENLEKALNLNDAASMTPAPEPEVPGVELKERPLGNV